MDNEYQYYKCDECGRNYTLVEMYSTASRCGSCNRAYQDERTEIQRRREEEDRRIQEQRDREDQDELWKIRP